MSPKEKAEELYKKMYTVHSNIYPSSAKQCTLIAVDEVLNQFRWKPSNGSSYWEEVKQELEKL